jgi:hypothetical protein
MISKQALIYLFHLFIVGPLLILIGYNQAISSDPELPSQSWAYSLLVFFGVMALAWHAYLYYTERPPINDKHFMINMIHILFGVLFIYIGRKQMGTSPLSRNNWLFYLLLTLGILIMGWHGYLLWKLYKLGILFIAENYRNMSVGMAVNSNKR